MKSALTEKQIKDMDDNNDEIIKDDDYISRMKRWKFVYPYMNYLSESFDYIVNTIRLMNSSLIKFKFNNLGY